MVDQAGFITSKSGRNSRPRPTSEPTALGSLSKQDISVLNAVLTAGLYDSVGHILCTPSLDIQERVDYAADPVNQTYTGDLLDFSADTHLPPIEFPDDRDLDTSLELSRQLQATLRRKQEEISALRNKNTQLRKLAKQAEHYATILDALTTSSQRDSLLYSTPLRTLSLKTHAKSTEGHSTGSEHSLISLLAQEEQSDPSYTPLTDSTSTETHCQTSGVKRQLWSSWHDLLDADGSTHRDDAEDTNLNYHSGSKRPRLDDELVELNLEHLKAQLDLDEWAPQQLKEDSALTQSLEDSSEGPIAERVNIFGAFHGLHVVAETPSVKSGLNTSGDQEKGMCFNISIREHSTVRTKVFPHGKAFTSHTPSGSCRFLWVPNED
ncbi:multicilin [Xyrauchen texanus]|uniref:multicilin n=1 Tax=Xyrauchen texanus TaxID=154827 RepID=UPI0022426F7F|nr:multicilin [Xyrauchen texanus]